MSPATSKPIDGPSRLVFAHQFMQLRAVPARRQLVEPNAAAVEDRPDLVKVVELFLHDLGHRPGQLGVLDVGEEQVHRHAGRLLLAVSMVDEQEIEPRRHLGEPAVGRGGVQVQHFCMIGIGWERDNRP